ncbi:hypothetical protein FH5_04175 [Priestia endophytica]|nr:hypothetical protein FH5_04175 [Priestia endophytica]
MKIDKLLTHPLFPIGIRKRIIECYEGNFSSSIYLGEIH